MHLGRGDFFGEIAALQQTPRSATAKALSQVKVLVLDSADLNALLQRNPAIRERIERVANMPSQAGWGQSQTSHPDK
ncbi:MAG: cyclic nucleotide-binding domain-containing protein [Beijerinckiaceae bacterium]|nr:cyclic nucleotide-binding domain-containing protein [Beijerinckiaceae bacterium]